MTESVSYYRTNATYSSRLYRLAVQAALRADERGSGVMVESDEKFYTEHAIEAVVMSINAAEAGINEIIAMSTMYLNVELPDELEKLELLVKWHLLPTIIVQKTFAKGAEPWQDFQTLVQLRNAWIHPKMFVAAPGWMRTLTAKDLPFRERRLDWRTATNTNRVARWAVTTVTNTFTELTRLLGKEADPIWAWGDRFFPSIPD
jgi:hypothetical protein